MSETTFQVSISHKELKEQFSKTATTEEWIEMYDLISESYGHWGFDLIIAEHILKKIKKEHIDSNMDLNDIPKILIPLLSDKIKNDFILENKKNEDISIEKCGSHSEFEAIKALRKIEVINYDTALNLYCNAYELGKSRSESKSLSDYKHGELLDELRNRI